MKRFDLRPLKDNFYDRMLELMDKDISQGENAIFLFEIGDFTCVQKSADIIYEAGYTLMNSLKFNEVDWTIVVKKIKPEPKIQEEFEEKTVIKNDDEDDDE
ncbi:MAG: NADH-ubiquinone oxidoreductase subunit E family protein [Halarcobacter sp.]